MNKDNVTLWSNKALDILFFNYPIRSAIGILVGIIIWFGFETYPTLFEFLQASNSHSAKIFFSLLGYLAIHSKTLVEGISGNILREDIKQTLNLIHIADVPNAQKRRMYKEAITKQINALDKHDIEEKKDETAGG